MTVATSRVTATRRSAMPDARNRGEALIDPAMTPMRLAAMVTLMS